MVELATEDGSSLATAGAPPAMAHVTSRQRPMMTATTLAAAFTTAPCSSRARRSSRHGSLSFTSRSRHW